MQSSQEGSTQFSACSFVEGRTRSPDQLQFATFSFFLLPYTDVTYTHGSVPSHNYIPKKCSVYCSNLCVCVCVCVCVCLCVCVSANVVSILVRHTVLRTIDIVFHS